MDRALSIIVLACGVIIVAIIISAALSVGKDAQMTMLQSSAMVNTASDLDEANARSIDGKTFSGRDVKKLCRNLRTDSIGIMVVTAKTPSGIYNVEEANDDSSDSFIGDSEEFTGHVIRQGDLNRLTGKYDSDSTIRGYQFVQNKVETVPVFNYEESLSKKNTQMLEIANAQADLFKEYQKVSGTLASFADAKNASDEAYADYARAKLYQEDSQNSGISASESEKIAQLNSITATYRNKIAFNEQLRELLQKSLQDHWYMLLSYYRPGKVDPGTSPSDSFSDSTAPPDILVTSNPLLDVDDPGEVTAPPAITIKPGDETDPDNGDDEDDEIPSDATYE